MSRSISVAFADKTALTSQIVHAIEALLESSHRGEQPFGVVTSVLESDESARDVDRVVVVLPDPDDATALAILGERIVGLSRLKREGYGNFIYCFGDTKSLPVRDLTKVTREARGQVAPLDANNKPDPDEAARAILAALNEGSLVRRLAANTLSEYVLRFWSRYVADFDSLVDAAHNDVSGRLARTPAVRLLYQFAQDTARLLRRWDRDEVRREDVRECFLIVADCIWSAMSLKASQGATFNLERPGESELRKSFASSNDARCVMVRVNPGLLLFALLSNFTAACRCGEQPDNLLRPAIVRIDAPPGFVRIEWSISDPLSTDLLTPPGMGHPSRDLRLDDVGRLYVTDLASSFRVLSENSGVEMSVEHLMNTEHRISLKLQRD